MAWVTKSSQETYVNNETPREYTKTEKAGNWWHYHKWHVVAVIVALVLGVLWHWSGLSMPAFAGSTLDFFAGMASPLALIALGGQIDFHPGRKGDLRPVALATVIKLVLIPLCFIPPALLMDFTPQETGALFLLYAAPTTVSSFAMAKGMGSNSDLAGRILLSSTIFSSFTLFIGIFLLRALGAI